MYQPSRKLTCALLGAALALCANASHAKDCYFSCVSRDCLVIDDGESIGAIAGEAKQLQRCENVEIKTGPIELIVFSNGKTHLFGPLDKIENKVVAQVASLNDNNCSFGESDCREERDKLALQSANAGKPFDGAASAKPQGKPCRMGLPCGLVRRPSQSMHILLEDPAFNGTLSLTATRGASGSIEMPVKAGVVDIPNTKLFEPGASFSYTLADTQKRIVAVGKFSLASKTMEQDFAEEFADAKQTLKSDLLATLQALHANNFEWDAYQLTKPEGAKR